MRLRKRGIVATLGLSGYARESGGGREEQQTRQTQPQLADRQGANRDADPINSLDVILLIRDTS